PGALSNAVENLGPRGGAFARSLAELAPRLGSPDELLDAGAVAGWRLGDARLRPSALEIAGRLPPAPLLAALGLADWPAAEAPRRPARQLQRLRRSLRGAAAAPGRRRLRRPPPLLGDVGRPRLPTRRRRLRLGLPARPGRGLPGQQAARPARPAGPRRGRDRD